MALEITGSSPKTEEATLSISTTGVRSGLGMAGSPPVDDSKFDPTESAVSPKGYDGAVVLHSSNPFEDYHSPLSHPHSHHFSSTPYTNHSHGVQLDQVPRTTTGTGYVDEEVRLAAEHLAQTLESAANQQMDESARKKLLRQAKRIRSKAKDGLLNDAEKENKPLTVLKNIGCGFLLLFTTPVYLSGVVIEGTGTMIKATGMIVKGFGTGMKKLHTVAMDKLDILV